jgi:hypothetical protein
MIVAAFALLLNAAHAANPPDGGKHAIHVGDTESKLISELGAPQRTITVEDGAGKVVGKHLYYVVETGSVRFYIEDGHILEITNERERR